MPTPERVGGATLGSAYEELLKALVHGQISEAEAIGTRIDDLLKQQGGSHARARNYSDSLRMLLDGIVSILSGDNRTGIEQLKPITESHDADKAIQFTAWLWITWATKDTGDLDGAMQTAKTLADLSEEMPPTARSVGLCTIAEVEAISGELDSALEHLTTANDILEEVDDRRGRSRTALAQARILANAGQDLDAGFAAQQAAELDPTWTEPILFMAQQGVKEGMVDKALEHLSSLERLGPRSPEASRLLGLVERIRQAQIPLWLVTEYLRLRDAVPSADTVAELQTMIMYSPQFLELREELAWKMVKVGRYEEAEDHFNGLLEREDLSPELTSSIRLGMGTLASLRDRHLPPGARVKAAVAAVSDPQEHKDKVVPQTEPEPRPRRLRTVSQATHLQRELEEVAGKKAVFSGDLQILQIPDLLEFLKNSKRTGTLVINSKWGVGAVYVRAGMITSAASPNCDHIGNLLLARGDIDEDQLTEAAAAQQDDDHHTLLGAIIVEQGAVNAETMREALTEQIYGAIRELFTWNEGQFAFSPDAREQKLPSTIEVELDPQHVLLDVARRLDEENA